MANAGLNVKIHDTTLRDGEQMPGVVFGFDEKLQMAEKAVEFGVDLIDIMPGVSETEFKVTRELAVRFNENISATCRSKKEDVDRAIDAGVKRITLFAPLSDLHIAQKLKITREENLTRAIEMIDYAKSHGLSVDFAGEDASRADIEYLSLFLESIHEKVESFFIADTVGCLTPESTRKLVWYIKRNYKCALGMHMHNDFGMATANTLEGIIAGADIFSGTFTGIGERAGNAPIEEVCTALHYVYQKELDVNYSMIKELCDMVQEYSGVKLQKHKPLVGENAFSHESGIHVDGILKNPRTYEFIEPEAIGQKRNICLGKHSGKKGLKYVLGEKGLGNGLDAEDVELILNEIKASYDRNEGQLSDEDIEKLILNIKGRQVLV